MPQQLTAQLLACHVASTCYEVRLGNKFQLFINTFYFLFLFYYCCYTPLVKGYCVFHFYLSYDEWHWAPFYVLFGLLYIFLEKMSIQILCPFLIGLSLLLSCKSSFYVLNTRPLSNMTCKYFLSTCGLHFHFFDNILWLHKSF